MDYKAGVRWLTRPQTIDRQIKEEEYQIEGLYTCIGLQGISYDKISVLSSPENKFERIIAEIDEHKRKVEDLRLVRIQIIHEISSRIEALGECPERTILYGFYVGGVEMEKIAKDLEYDISWCYRLRRKGIKNL